MDIINMGHYIQSGTLSLGPFEAEIVKSDYSSENDTYCKFKIGHNFFRTETSKNCGTKPK